MKTGILTQAQKAKNETENATVNEVVILNDYENKIKETLGIKPEAEPEPGYYYETNTEVQIGGKELTIPGGASLSKIEGEYEDVDQGIVIYITNKQMTDEEWQDMENMKTTYDQFVWIPVTENYKRNINYEHIGVSSTAYTDIDYLPEGIQPEADDTTNNEQAEREAVLNKGGFYISRYEAGKERTDTLVSKAGATVWNEISQADCKTTAKTFINNGNIKSGLCSGIQWDKTMEFVNGKQDGSNDLEKIFNVVETKMSRHTGLQEETGKNETDKVCNIYDLEGNYTEYVAEKNSYKDSFFCHRGGTGKGIYSASYRFANSGEAFDNFSFRFVLYVN